MSGSRSGRFCEKLLQVKNTRKDGRRMMGRMGWIGWFSSGKWMAKDEDDRQMMMFRVQEQAPCHTTWEGNAMGTQSIYRGYGAPSCLSRSPSSTCWTADSAYQYLIYKSLIGLILAQSVVSGQWSMVNGHRPLVSAEWMWVVLAVLLRFGLGMSSGQLARNILRCTVPALFPKLSHVYCLYV